MVKMERKSIDKLKAAPLILMNKQMLSMGARKAYQRPKAEENNFYRDHREYFTQSMNKEQKIIYLLNN